MADWRKSAAAIVSSSPKTSTPATQNTNIKTENTSPGEPKNSGGWKDSAKNIMSDLTAQANVTAEEQTVFEKYGINPATFDSEGFKSWAEAHNFEYRLAGNELTGKEYKWLPKNNSGWKFWETLTTKEEEADKKVLERFIEKKAVQANAKNHPGLTSAATIVTAPIRGLAGAVAVAKDTVTAAVGADVNTNDTAHNIVEDANLIRNTATEEHASEWFGGAGGKLGNYGALTYNGLMSIGDTVMISLTTKGIGKGIGLVGKGLAAFASSATSGLLASTGGASTIIEKKKEGLSDEKAVLNGLAAAAAEFITEKISLDLIFNTPSSALKKGIVSFFAEGTEEMSSDVITKIADYFISGDDSTIKKNISRYMQSGMSKSAAVKQTTWDSIYETLSAGLVGGVSGIALGSVYHGFEAPEIKRLGADYRDVASDIVQTGLDSPENSVSHKYAEKLSKKGVDKISDYELGTLHRYNVEQITHEQEQEAKALKKAEKNQKKATKSSAESTTTASKTSKVAPVSIGDTFQDTKYGNTITVVERDDTNTTVEINNGTNTERKVVTNEQADTLISRGQYARVETPATNIDGSVTPDTVEAFRSDTDGKFRFNQADIDYSNSSERKGQFRVRGTGTSVRTVTGHISGKYGVYKNEASKNYNVCLLQSGLEVGQFKTLSEAKKAAAYLDANLPFNNWTYAQSGDAYIVEHSDAIKDYVESVRKILNDKPYGKATVTSSDTVNKDLKSENKSGKINEVETEETVDESAGISNETNKSRETLEDDERHSKVQVESGVETIPSRRSDRLYRESDGRNDRIRNRNIPTRTAKSETRRLEDIIENDSFIRLAKTVGDGVALAQYKTIKAVYGNDPRLDEGYDFSDVVAYDILADENNELRNLFADEIAEYFNENDSSDVDSTGEKLSDETLDSLKDSVVRNDKGQLIPLYHATDKTFDKFKVGDIGFHFGSYNQARRLAADKEFIENARFIKGYLNITKPIIIEQDNPRWDANQLAKILSDMGIISREQSLAFAKSEKSIKELNDELRELLESKKYDGIIYKNQHESGYADSYIVFNDSQIVRADDAKAPQQSQKSERKAKSNQQMSNTREAIEVDGKGTVMWSSLHPRQQKAITFMEGLAKAAKLELVITANAPFNGAYDVIGDTMYLDIYAGTDPMNKAADIIIPTASHELTHWMEYKAPALWNKVSSAIFSALEEVDGISESDRIANEIARLKRKKRVANEKIARSEIVARACEDMLKRSEHGTTLFNSLSESEQKTLHNKIKDIIANLKNWISDMLASYQSGSYEATALRKCGAKLDEISKLWDGAFAESVKVSKATPKDFSHNGELGSKLHDAANILYNERYIENHIEQLKKAHSSESNLSVPEILSRYKKIADIWQRLGGELNSAFLNDWNSRVGKDRAFTIFKAQSGYDYNVELSSMCKKGIPLFEAIDTIVKTEAMKELKVKKLGKAEKEILYDLLKTNGFEIPCAICYVEQARQREGNIIDAFLNGKVEKTPSGKTTTFKLGWNETLVRIQGEMQKAGVSYTFPALDRSVATENYSPADIAMDEPTQEAYYNALKKIANEEIRRYNKENDKNIKLITTTDADSLKKTFKGNLPLNLRMFKTLFFEPSSRFTIDEDLLYSSMTTLNLAAMHNGLYSVFNSQGGTGGYKTKQGSVIYWGDILNKKWVPEKLRSVGGVRNQSNSDFLMYTLLDHAQMYLDFTAKGYYLQAYTKVLAELKLFGLSGGKHNASFIPRVIEYKNADGSVDEAKTRENAGLDEKGNPAYDDIEGVPHEEAFMLIEDEDYSKSIGGVCIGYSDKHISKLLDDPRIQLIIGFHDNTNDPAKRYKGAVYAKNYNGLNEATKTKADGTLSTEHIGFNQFVMQAENKFKGKKSTTFNGKTYSRNDVPKLAADIYLAYCDKKGLNPAYSQLGTDGVDFSKHPNYYKLLADFSLYDSNGNYAPHTKVEYNMPDKVPYLDVNGKKSYIATEDYIKQELKKELAVRDAISEKLADRSDDGIIPQFVKRANALYGEGVLLSDRGENADASHDAEWYEMQDMHKEIMGLLEKQRAIEDSEAYSQAMDDFLKDADVNSAADTFNKFLDESGYSEITERLTTLQSKLGDMQNRRENERKARALDAERKAVAESGLSEADYFRKKAVKEFGYTPFFYDAGYITPNGKMLNFSGEKGKHFGMRGQDHRGIGVVYADTSGGKAMLRFMGEGNVRIMAESPGVDISSAVEPTKEQYATIRKFVREYAGRGYFNVDITDADGYTVGNYSYEGRVSAERVANDIKYFFANGTTREQSAVSQFLYSDRDDYAPMFYSHMAKVIDGMKQNKMGASDVIRYLTDTKRGVRKEEIKWSGIETFLDGKKSVTKAELQDFVKSSMLQIETKTMSADATIEYTETESADLDAIEDAIVEKWQAIEDLWFDKYGYSIPMDIRFNDNSVSALYRELNKRKKSDNDETFQNEVVRHLNRIEVLESNRDYIVQRARQRTQKDIGTTRYENYTLDGGSNYRELLFKLPGSAYSNAAMDTHWGDKGILAHARVQDFDVDGKKMLFIEEIQSDWHNEGHKEGYANTTMAKVLDKKYEELQNKNKTERQRLIDELAKFYDGKVDEPLTAAKDDIFNAFMNLDLWNLSVKRYGIPAELISRVEALRKSRQETADIAHKVYELERGVEDAPFKDNYHEYVLKNILRMAAEQGYDSIGWTPADVQSKRWSDEYAEGYRIEYDQDIPKFLNRYGEKWGAKVGKTELDSDNGSISYLDDSGKTHKSIREWYEAVMDQFAETDKTIWNTYISGGYKVIEDDGTMRIQNKQSGNLLDDTLYLIAEPLSVWSMPITDTMKEAVLYEGQALYSLRDDGVPDLFEAWDESERAESKKAQAPKKTTQSSTVKSNKAMAAQPAVPENKWIDSDATSAPAPDEIPSVSEIVKDIKDSFGLPIKSGKVTARNAAGIYKVLPEVIRTKISNDLPTIVHELGHHLSKRYGLEKSQHINEADVLVDSNWLSQYPAADVPGELAAEFVRRYFKNPEAVAKKCPNLTQDFLGALNKRDTKSVERIASKVHTYMSAHVGDTYGATIIDAKTAKRLDKTDLSDQAHDLYTKWFSQFHPIKQLVDFVEESTGKVAVGIKNAYKLATNSLNAHNIANFVLLEKFRDLNGNIISEHNSFVECVKGINLTDQKTRKDFSEYLKHAHSVEVITKGKDVYANENQSDLKNIIAKMTLLEREYPAFKHAAENLYDFQYNVLTEYAVKSGLMTQEQADFLHAEYPCYVPFYRYIKGKKGSFARRSLANQKSPIMRMKGSGLDTLDSLESIIKNTEKIISAAIKHQTVDLIGQYADTVDGVGAFIERVPPDQVAKTVDVTALKKDFLKRLQDIVKSSDDYFAVTDLLNEVFGDEVTGFNPVVNEKERIIAVQRGDERAYYQVHNEALFESITEMSPKQASGLLNLLATSMGRLNALITQFNPMFSIANPLRDIKTAYDLGDIDNPVEFIRDYAKSLKLILTNSDAYQQFKAMGGGHSSRLNAELGEISKSVKDLQMQDAGLARRLVYSITHHPIQALTAFADFTESVPRFMTFMNSYNKTGDVQEAMYQADDITTNFKRRGSGATAKVINSTFRFNNAALQGLDKTRRTFADADGKRKVQITAKWLTEAILMALLLNFINREKDKEGYENLSSYKKNNFYNIALGDGQFLSLPKERENAVLNSLVERTVDALCGEDDAFYDFGGYLASQLLPPMIPGTLNPIDATHDLLNSTLAGPFTDIGFNKDFKGAPIESDYEQDKVSSERYDEGTSKLAYELGQTKFAVNADLSPKKIDHLLSTFGFLASANSALFPVNDSRKDATLGLRNRFISDSNYSTDVINKVYDNRDLAKRDFNYYLSQNEATADKAVEYEQTAIVTDFVSGMNKAIKAMPEEDQRRGRGYLVQALNRWNYSNTSSQADMIKRLGKETLTNDDCILTDVPDSLLTWSETKKDKYGRTIKGSDGKAVKVKYSYQMTPQEYHKYVTDYLNMVDKYRMYQGKLISDTEEYLTALAATKTEVSKVTEKKYQDLYAAKASKTEQ